MTASGNCGVPDVIVTAGDPTDAELAAVIAALLARGTISAGRPEPAVTAVVRDLAPWRREPSWRRRAAA